MLGPALVLALAGLACLLFAERLKQFRVLGISCVVAFLVLLVLRGKPYYIGPIYPALFAAGGVVLAQAVSKLGQRLRRITCCTLVVAGVVYLPFGLPILPPPLMARFAAGVGLTAATTTNRGTVLPLPQDYADMLGWERQVKAVQAAVQTLPPEKRAEAGLGARNYGEAGALEFYGPKDALPRTIMLPDNFLLWPPDNSCRVVVTIGIPQRDLEQFFESVSVVSRFDDPWMVDEERNVEICVAEKPLRPLDEGWKRPPPLRRSF
jgi:hypothetical protein